MGFISDDERSTRAAREQRELTEAQTRTHLAIERLKNEVQTIVNRVTHEAQRIYMQRGYVDTCTVALSGDYWPLVRNYEANTILRDALRSAEPNTATAYLHHRRENNLMHVTVRFNPYLT